MIFDHEVANIDDRRSRIRNVPQWETARHRGEQFAGVGMLRLTQEILGCALLDDLALAHNDDAVGVTGDHRQVVADHQHGSATRPRQLDHQFQHVALNHGIERRGRLVGDRAAPA